MSPHHQVSHQNPAVAMDAKQGTHGGSSSPSCSGDYADCKDVKVHMPAVPPPPPPPAVMKVDATVTAPEVYRVLVAAGEAKLHASWFKLAVMGMLAGFYVSFGFSFCASCIGNLGNVIYGALAFPTGLLLIVLCGAELFTGNTCYMFTANIEGKANFWHHQKIIWSAYFWNLVGSLIIVGLEKGGSCWKGREDYIHNLAYKKIKLSWAEVVCRAIIANWLVNLAVYQAFAARDVMGKAIGVWTPITAFVAIGLEHCIANMFIIPMSIYLPFPANSAWRTDHFFMEHGPITWAMFIRRNLIPATIGNWIGGAIMVGTFYACVYGDTIPRTKDAVCDAVTGKIRKGYDATLGKCIPRENLELPQIPCINAPCTKA